MKKINITIPPVNFCTGCLLFWSMRTLIINALVLSENENAPWCKYPYTCAKN